MFRSLQIRVLKTTGKQMGVLRTQETPNINESVRLRNPLSQTLNLASVGRPFMIRVLSVPGECGKRFFQFFLFRAVNLRNMRSLFSSLGATEKLQLALRKSSVQAAIRWATTTLRLPLDFH